MTREPAGRGKARARSSDLLCLAFTGTSMKPVLLPGDLLEVMPYGRRLVRPGDVIFFVADVQGPPVVHRVLNVTAAGIRTRGDNNPHEDRLLVQPENVVGRVVAALRGRRRHQIAGGTSGLVVAALCRVRRRTLRSLVPLVRHRFEGARTGLPAVLKPRLVSFASPHGEYWRLLLGRQVIATYRPHARGWQVRLPYRLLLDPGSLPVPGGAQSAEHPRGEAPDLAAGGAAD